MATQQDVDAAFAAVRAEWNRAEGAIKLAEQVNHEIVNPAIYELRYAGRRVVEAYDSHDKAVAIQRLNDAHFDCMRARHDAIDAATSKMTAMMDIAVDKLGADIVLTHFGAFPDLVYRLGVVRDLIAVSREDRENRDKIYASIEADNLADLITTYNKFRASEGLMRQSAEKARSEKTWNRLFGWAGIIGVVLSIAFFVYQTWIAGQPPPHP